MLASEPDQTPMNRFRPGDFARILLAASRSPPRTRARDQQAGAVSGNLLLVHSACLILPGSKSTDNDHQGFQGT
jgi:hypothetical protein